MQDIPIGERIRLFRLSRGMTQEQLAGLADVSPSWLSKAERGVPLDRRMGPLSRIAEVLGVSVGELVGQRAPRRSGADARTGALDVGALHRALLSGGIAARAEEAVDLQRLVDDAAEAWRLRQGCRYSALITNLPGLIAHGEKARNDLTGRDRASACEALTMIYASASALCEHIGEIELAAAAAALATRVVEECGSPSLGGIIARRTALVLLRMGEESQALDRCMAAARELERCPRSETAHEIAVRGSMFLTSAVAAARSGDAPSAWDLLAEADRDASRFGLERMHMPTTFGVANVLLYGIDIAVELGDPRTAMRRAGALDPSRFPAELGFRRSHYWITLARAHALMHKPDEAVDALLRAEQIAPEEVRCQVLVRETVRDLLHRKRQSVAPQLAGLAKRLGTSSN